MVSPFVGSGISGAIDGIGSEASFNQPFDITIDQRTGNLFVTDNANHLIREINPQGMCDPYSVFAQH